MAPVKAPWTKADDTTRDTEKCLLYAWLTLPSSSLIFDLCSCLVYTCLYLLQENEEMTLI